MTPGTASKPRAVFAPLLVSAMRKVCAPGGNGTTHPVLTRSERAYLDAYLDWTAPLVVEAILKEGLSDWGRGRSKKPKSAGGAGLSFRGSTYSSPSPSGHLKVASKGGT